MVFIQKGPIGINRVPVYQGHEHQIGADCERCNDECPARQVLGDPGKRRHVYKDDIGVFQPMLFVRIKDDL